MRERFGLPVHNGYGLTEASPVVTTTAVEAVPRVGSVGPPLPGVEVQLLDTDGKPVLEGDPGEIAVRGANVFAGYWNDPDATAAVLVDGWLHTGDIAVADSDGWFAARRPRQGRHHRLRLQRVSRAKSKTRCARIPMSTTSRWSANRIRARAKPSSRTSCRPRARHPDPVDVVAARGPATRALQAADPRRARRRVAAHASRASWCDASSPNAPHRPTRRRSPRRSPRFRPRARSRSFRRRRPRLASRPPLARINVPSAINALPPASEPDPGVRRRVNRTADHTAPANTTSAPTLLETAASTRGNAPKWSLPTGMPPTGLIGAVDRARQHHAGREAR